MAGEAVGELCGASRRDRAGAAIDVVLTIKRAIGAGKYYSHDISILISLQLFFSIAAMVLLNQVPNNCPISSGFPHADIGLSGLIDLNQ